MLSINKQAYLQTVLNWVRLGGYTDIKANAEGYPMPASYGQRGGEKSFVPDVTGQQDGQTSYFEIVLKTKDTEELTIKLKLLHQLARLRGGQLILLTPKGHAIFAKAIADANQISAEIIVLPDRKTVS
ncbi:hypothetical protein GCM10028805_06950 [Spirosoma harenae]